MNRGVEWDKFKAAANLHKHGISFEVASTAFEDMTGMIWSDRFHSVLEARFTLLGLSIEGDVLRVTFTVRNAGERNEKIRIISARKASSKERQVYARQRD